MLKNHLAFVVFLMIPLLFLSCANENIHPREVVYAMKKASGAGNNCTVYTTESTEGSPDFLSAALLRELYGDGFDFSSVSGALCLSGRQTLFELAVFNCPDPESADALGGICALRFFEAVKTAKQMGLEVADVTVRVYGNHVLAAMCRDSLTAVEAGVEKIKGVKRR